MQEVDLRCDMCIIFNNINNISVIGTKMVINTIMLLLTA